MDKGKARQLDTDPKVVPPRDRVEDSPLTYNQLVAGLIDFLEVAFHTILCMRSVYPYDVFARRKKYSHPCYQSRHPGLTEYISRVLAALRSEIEKSSVSKVILVIRPNVVADPSDGVSGSGSSAGISSSDGGPNPADPYERFVFSLDYILPSSLIDPRDRDLAISSNVTSNELEQIFRGFVQKLMVVDGILYDMPASTASASRDSDGAPATELTFAVVLEMIDEDTSPSGRDRHQPNTGDWIPADGETLGRTHRSPRHGSGDGVDLAPKIRPIKTLDSGVINMMLYVEEDLFAKSSHGQHNPRGSPSKRNSAVKPTSAQPLRKPQGIEDELLLTKATQIDVSTAGGNARDLKNRARRLDAERDLDQPALAEVDAEPDIAQAKTKRKRARMVLGETRAAESDSESSSSGPSSPSGSSQSVRDAFGGHLSGGF
ncbi:related to mitotic spindle assembly checkpoint protein mad2b [Melanopsichium pennsylvanicum]|uniref:Related to mitotic spindle assembly checkpoint protein mad2b n=2 Tax=Melanopsichium pennsylvanicum TaxID=63383 RepID=A0AAJ5C3Z1_9BASI|nr:related to mitotic spindle assembly checkpoint protein mad2b [Melanopsichium pennsylvanicum 4]SNX83130.1 related to mitotic spindle assembly checkpoint protein mad2b [Melanopsichium pennsylvanicum]